MASGGRITAGERDQIDAALALSPDGLDEIALTFGLTRGTIHKIQRVMHNSSTGLLACHISRRERIQS